MSDTDDAVERSLTVAPTDVDIETLFRAHYRRLCRVIYRVVGQADLAEALAGDAFWKLHRKRPARLTNAEAWLCRTGIRLALDHLRRERRRRHYETTAFEEGSRAFDAGTRTAVHASPPSDLSAGASTRRSRTASEPAVAADSEEDLARADERRQVRDVLALIKPTHAAILLLRAEGLTYAQLAGALRINPASIGTMLARAEARFKQVYEARHPRPDHRAARPDHRDSGQDHAVSTSPRRRST